MICPCKGCDDRHVGCHSKCELYLKWNEEHLAKKKEINLKRGEEIDFWRAKRDIIERTKKNGRKHKRGQI